jgi:nucleotide-binding universal stress UspA family protein
VTYATLMVHLQLGQSNAGLLRIAGDLAERFQAAVIGIAACQPMQIYGEGYVPADIIDQDREEIDKEMKAAEAEFRAALGSRIGDLAWRATVAFTSLADYLAQEARCADLLVTGVDRNASLFDASRHVAMGDLVMQIGRPVLVVPAAASKLAFDRIVLGWKDTRETRRAACDALPLLKRAGHVAVVAIAPPEEMTAARAQLEDVVGWLARHGVAAEALASPSTGDDAAELNEIADEQGADLIVAGAYGHSRLREWVLGGVTRDLLLRADRSSLVSH